MLDSILACPRCDNALTATDGGHACGGCKVEFPSISGIPFLFAEPSAALGEWRARLHMETQRLGYEIRLIDATLDDPDLRDSTRRRMKLLRAANYDHSERLLALLEPLGLVGLQANLESYLALRTRLPTDQGLITYYPNVHRDWSWGERENEASADLITDMLDQPLGKLLVLGAGPARLAYDLHNRLTPELTVALDFNPLFMLLAQRLLRGETVELYEFPIAPNSIENSAILRTLKAEAPVSGAFELIIADAARAPFLNGSFDTIITPWVTDILPSDIAETAARINHLLRDDGQWVNFGSLAFEHADPGKRYSREEVVDIVAGQGFTRPHVDETRIPYMCSPASRHGRQETVVTFAARKNKKAKKLPRHAALPDWLVKGDAPVPLSDSFRMQATSTRIHAFVMSLIDGKRSIRDMAELMEAQKLMAQHEAMPTIRTFLIKMLEDG